MAIWCQSSLWTKPQHLKGQGRGTIYSHYLHEGGQLYRKYCTIFQFFLHRIFYSSLVNLLKFYFPDVEDYMEFNLQSESDMIKAWIKDYNIGRRGAMLLNSLIKKIHKLKLIYITNIYHIWYYTIDLL